MSSGVWDFEFQLGDYIFDESGGYDFYIIILIKKNLYYFIISPGKMLLLRLREYKGYVVLSKHLSLNNK